MNITDIFKLDAKVNIESSNEILAKYKHYIIFVAIYKRNK